MTDSGTELQQPTETPKQIWDRTIAYVVESFKERADILKILNVPDADSFKSMMETISKIDGIQPEHFSAMTGFADLNDKQKQQIYELYKSYVDYFQPQEQIGIFLRTEHKIALFCAAIRNVKEQTSDQNNPNSVKDVISRITQYFENSENKS